MIERVKHLPPELNVIAFADWEVLREVRIHVVPPRPVDDVPRAEIAMQNATNAAGDLIKALTLYANKVRQAGITTELMEIVSGAEAMRASS